MIQAKHITKKFGRLKALDDVSVQMNAGECIAILGPNGCGKTTLLKTVLGMVVADSGEVMVKNEIVKKSNWQYRRHIGYMPQIGRYPSNMKIADVINMMKDIRQNGELNEELASAFDLPALNQKKMGNLSGGTTQKVSAVLAFMFNPDILILDEPTAGLDPLSSEKLKAKIKAENDKGKLVIITSHILSELDDLVTEVIYMQEGKIIFHKKIKTLQDETGEIKLSKAIASILQSGVK